MSTDLEQTQLEFARLQLAQERRKLAQLQKRQRVVDGLGAGAAAVGGTAKKGAYLLFFTTFCAVGGCLIAAGVAAFYALAWSRLSCPAYPDAALLYRIGCALGAHHELLLWAGAAGLVIGAAVGFRAFREFHPSR